MTPLTGPSSPSNVDATVTLRELEPLLLALARRSGVELTLELAETAPLRTVSELFRWAFLDAVVYGLGAASAEGRNAEIGLEDGGAGITLDLHPLPPMDEILHAALLSSGAVVDGSESRIRWPSSISESE